MKLITVKELFSDSQKYLEQEIEVGGWVRSNRGSKAFGFLVLNDGTCFQTLQVVYHDTMDNFGEISKINVGAAPDQHVSGRIPGAFPGGLRHP